VHVEDGVSFWRRKQRLSVFESEILRRMFTRRRGQTYTFT